TAGEYSRPWYFIINGLSLARKSAKIAIPNRPATMIRPNIDTLFFLNCRETTCQYSSGRRVGGPAATGPIAEASTVRISITPCLGRDSVFIGNPWIDNRVEEIGEQNAHQRQQRAQREYGHDEWIIAIQNRLEAQIAHAGY